MKIALIAQRYGTEIIGGSEYHCRLVAERLADAHDVDVLTTCARDYLTWKNEYSEGADRVRGVTVRRFATTRTRDLAAFNRYSEWIFTHAHTRDHEIEWLKQQGPWAPGLIEYLQRHHQHYDALIFFTYLYAPTVLGLRIAPWKSLLVPTAHDEPAINLGIYEDVFSSAAGLVWNTDAERRFVTSRFHLRAHVEEVVGCGVDLPEGEAGADAPGLRPEPPPSREPLAPHIEGPANAFRRRHRMHEPFVLYGGRIDPGKGCEEMLEYFQTYLREGGDATLMLMGVKLMPLPEDPHVRFAGLLPDEERLHALEAAEVVLVPSPYESLSLLALEAFAVGTPVLANARAEALVDHCRASNAGLYYADRWEFAEALRLLMRNPDLRDAMGRNGQDYVNRNYRWSTILAKYERMLAKVRGGAPEEGTEPRDRDDSRGRQSRGSDRGRERGGERGGGRERGAERGRDRGGDRSRGRGRGDRSRDRDGDRSSGGRDDRARGRDGERRPQARTGEADGQRQDGRRPDANRPAGTQPAESRGRRSGRRRRRGGRPPGGSGSGGES